MSTSDEDNAAALDVDGANPAPGDAWSATLANDLDATGASESTARIVLALSLIRHRPQSAVLQMHADEGDLDAASRVDTARARYLDTLGWTFENVTIADVAREIGVDRPRATRLTARLERDGLIERTKARDGRAYLVRLTERGQQVVRLRHAARARRIDAALQLAGFPPDEQDAFAEKLEAFAYAWLGVPNSPEEPEDSDDQPDEAHD